MFKADNDGQQAPSSSKLMPRKFSAKRKQTSLLSDLTHFKRRATLAAQICAERLRLMTVFNDHVQNMRAWSIDPVSSLRKGGPGNSRTYAGHAA